MILGGFLRKLRDMREGLRSSSQKSKCEGEEDDCDVGRVNLPDLNLNDDFGGAGSGGEGGNFGDELSRKIEYYNGSLFEKDEWKAMEVERKEGENGGEGKVGNVGWKLKACSVGMNNGEKNDDDCSGVLVKDNGVGEEGFEMGGKGLSSVRNEERRVEFGSEVNGGNVQSDFSALLECRDQMDGVEGTDSKVDENNKGESLNKEAEDGRVQVAARILRSRVVPSVSVGELSGSPRAVHQKRKRLTEDHGEEVVPNKGEGDKLTAHSEKSCKRGRPKKVDHLSKEGEVQVIKDEVVSEAGEEELNNCPALSPEQNHKRGRPRTSMGTPEEKVLQPSEVLIAPKVEDREMINQVVQTPESKRKRGRPKKCLDAPEEKDANPTKLVQVIPGVKGPRSLLHEQGPVVVDCAAEDEIRAVSDAPSGILEKEDKCFTPDVSVPEILVHKADDELDNDDEEEENNFSDENSRKKHKRGRPKSEESALKLTYQKKVKSDRKMKFSLTPVRKSPRNIHPHRTQEMQSNGVPKVKVISPNKKISHSGPRKSIGEEKSMSTKKKRDEQAGSVAAEKNLIRQQIVDMLLAAGWTIEYRPRHGRSYNDAVYVNCEGKTHWSVTKAYYTLKQEFEESKGRSTAANSNFCFTPIPEEILSKLFRVVSKIRCDKNKKKRKHTGDSDDDIEDRGKAGAKRKSSGMKRKPNVQNGVRGKRRCALLVRRSKTSETDGVSGHPGKHSILAWMIDSGAIPMDVKVQYMNRRRTKVLLEGNVTRDGIRCQCCKEVISVLEFEDHAGSTLGQPYENIYLENDMSLLKCLVDSWNKQEESGRSGFHSVPIDGDDPNDDTCGICGDGGNLVCCDGCPSTFHSDCLDVEEVPSGEWHCVFCSCKFCGCVGEAASDSDDDCDTPSPLLSCSLCEAKYHISCTEGDDTVHFVPGEPSFCGRTCEQIFERLQNLFGDRRELGDGFSYSLLQHSDVKSDIFDTGARKILSNAKLAVALSIMDECFVPITDPRSSVDLIRHVVYNCGSNFKRLDFSSFFTVVLERGNEVISAASVRIRGKQLAEMPFIGTRNVYRRQGMCRRLLNAIELALVSVGVESLVIPAVPDLMHTWTSVFGFKPLENSVKEETKSMSLLVFTHMDMLQKPLSSRQAVGKSVSIPDEEVKCSAAENEHPDGDVDKSEVDDGCPNGTIDLNSVAPDPESTSDEKYTCQLASVSDPLEDEVKSRTGLVDQPMKDDQADKDEARSRRELMDASMKVDKVEASGLVMNSFGGDTLRPDLNLMECADAVNLKVLKVSSDENCHSLKASGIVDSDEAVKSTEDSLCLTNIKGQSNVGNGVDQDGVFVSVNSFPKERTLNLDLNLMEDVSGICEETDCQEDIASAETFPLSKKDSLPNSDGSCNVSSGAGDPHGPVFTYGNGVPEAGSDL